MADAIGNRHRAEDLVQIGIGVLLLAIVSFSCWEASNINHDKGNSSALLSPGRIMDKLKDEIHQNVDKLHGEMGFAEWIVYFIYGAFVAIVLAVVLLLMLLKYRSNSRRFTDASTQTGSISSILHGLLDSFGESEAAVCMQTPFSNVCCTEDSGVNFIKDFEDTDSRHQQNGFEDVRNEYLDQPYEKYTDPDETIRLHCARTRLDISFLKTQNRHYPGDTVFQSSFAITTPQSDDSVTILEYYSTHYFMPGCFNEGRDSREDSPDSAGEIPMIEITVDGINGGVQYFN